MKKTYTLLFYEKGKWLWSGCDPNHSLEQAIEKGREFIKNGFDREVQIRECCETHPRGFVEVLSLSSEISQSSLFEVKNDSKI